MAALWQAYIEDRAGRRIAENMGFSGKAILPVFGALRPGDITVKIVRAYVAKRAAAGRQNGTIVTELNHLRIVLSWAKKSGLIADVPAIEMPSRPPPKDRHLSREEAARLLAASETPHLRLFIILAISTAGRAGALFDLTWDRVDFERGLIYLGARHALRPQKGRAIVPMSQQARAALSEARQGAMTEYVLEWGGTRIASVRTALAKAADRAGIAGVSPHVLRHTAACWMAEDGIPMEEIARVLGHSDSRITAQVYARYSPEYLRGATRSLTIG